MKIENSIGWCDDTGNKVTGCDKVSPGCKNCYAQVGTRARVLRAQGIETWGPKGVRHPVAGFAASLRRLNRYLICDRCHHVEPVGSDDCRRCSDSTLRRIRFFADSNSDWLDHKWPIETLAGFLKEIHDAPNVDVLLLTKRIENWQVRLWEVVEQYRGLPTQAERMPAHVAGRWINGDAPANVWLGVSVEDQQRADERIPVLLQIPAKVRFLSVEPLLEAVDLGTCLGEIELASFSAFNSKATTYGGIGWVIVGGESGGERRDCGVEAIGSVAEQCQAAGVPCFVKQDCAFKSGQQGRIPAQVWALKQFPKGA